MRWNFEEKKFWRNINYSFQLSIIFWFQIYQCILLNNREYIISSNFHQHCNDFSVKQEGHLNFKLIINTHAYWVTSITKKMNPGRHSSNPNIKLICNFSNHDFFSSNVQPWRSRRSFCNVVVVVVCGWCAEESPRSPTDSFSIDSSHTAAPLPPLKTTLFTPGPQTAKPLHHSRGHHVFFILFWLVWISLVMNF